MHKNFAFKLAIGCAIGSVLMPLLGFVAFPKLIKSKIKKMVNLGPKTDVRQMFVKIPFPLEFRIYIFNVTNPIQVANGELPIVNEVGPFCFEEWKEKVDVQDNEKNDTMVYKPKDTFLKKMWPGCFTGDEMITIPHPMILGMVNTILLTKPAMLTLANKAIISIYKNTTSIFLTAKAIDILFDGIVIDCGVTDFPGKAVCSQLKALPSLKKISETELSFSFLSSKNATLGQEYQVYRGTKKYRNVGQIIKVDGKTKLDTWSGEMCNEIKGTDGTIFPPLLKKEQGLATFSSDLCRSIVAVYENKTEYNKIPVNVFTATLGDMSKNPNEKCFCPTPDKCMKKGMMDLFPCTGVPLYASLPHFYDCDESYLSAVIGLKPNKEKHEIRIFFEQMTGTPISAVKRMMFSMPLQPVEKVIIFNNLPTTILPLFWIEESVELNSTITAPVQTLYSTKKNINILTCMIILGCLGTTWYALHVYFSKRNESNVTPVDSSKKESSTTESTYNQELLNRINKVVTLQREPRY